MEGTGFDEAELLESREDGREQPGDDEEVQIGMVMQSLELDMPSWGHKMPGMASADCERICVDCEQGLQRVFVLLKTAWIPDVIITSRVVGITHQVSLHRKFLS